MNSNRSSVSDKRSSSLVMFGLLQLDEQPPGMWSVLYFILYCMFTVSVYTHTCIIEQGFPLYNSEPLSPPVHSESSRCKASDKSYTVLKRVCKTQCQEILPLVFYHLDPFWARGSWEIFFTHLIWLQHECANTVYCKWKII